MYHVRRMLSDGAETNQEIGNEFQVIRAKDSLEMFEEYFLEFYGLTYIRPDEVVADDVIMSLDYLHSRMTEAFIIYGYDDEFDNFQIIPVAPHLSCYVMTDSGGTFSRVNSGSMDGLSVRSSTNEVGPVEWARIMDDKDAEQVKEMVALAK